MSSGGRAFHYNYPPHPPQPPGYISTVQWSAPGEVWHQGGDPLRRRHPSEGHPVHYQQVSGYGQWQGKPHPLQAGSRRSSTDSTSSNHFSNPRSPTESYHSEDGFLPPQPQEYSRNSMIHEGIPEGSAYHQSKQYNLVQHPPNQMPHWGQHTVPLEYRRRSTTDVPAVRHPPPPMDVYKGNYVNVAVQLPPKVSSPDFSYSNRRPNLLQSGIPRSGSNLSNFSQHSGEFQTVYSHPPPPVYERVKDVYPSHGGQTKVGNELRRAPSSQSVSSTGSRQSSSSDYQGLRQRRDRGSGSREDVCQPPPAPSCGQPTQSYSKQMDDHKPSLNGHLSHGSVAYQSPESMDSGFHSFAPSDVQNQPNSQRPAQRMGFTRAQTMPPEVWTEGDKQRMRSITNDSWYIEGDNEPVGNGMSSNGSTIPQMDGNLVAGKPNGRYFPFTPPKVEDQLVVAKKTINKKSKSSSFVNPLKSPFMSRSMSGAFSRWSRKKKNKGSEDGATPDPDTLVVLPRRSNSISVPPEEDRSRRAQSLEHLSEVTSLTSPNSDESHSGVLATIGTPKRLRTFKFKKSSEGDNSSLSGSLSNLFKGDRGTSKKQPPGEDSYRLFFSAILNKDIEKVQYFLENEIADCNCKNEDGFTALDLSIMMDNPSLSKLLQHYGSKDSQQFFKDPNVRISTLTSLINQCEHEITLLMLQSLEAGGYTTSSVAKDLGRKLQQWEWRRFYFKRMKQFCKTVEPPGPPQNVRLTVNSSSKLTVSFSEPQSEQSSPTVITRYRIEWSIDENFSELAGERTMADVRHLEYTIPELKQGERYYVRVSACNVAGFGPVAASVPNYAVPSTWHDLVESKPRYEGSFNRILTLGASTQDFYTQNGSAVVLSDPSSSPTTAASARQKSIKKGISKLFGNIIKFHKNLKSGLYLALLLYSDEEKVLVTSDDNFPIVEVGDDYNRASFGSDMSWLNKVLCASDLVKTLRDWSSSCTSSPNIHFKNKILAVLADLQSATGVQDLGMLYPMPYFDGVSTVLVVVNYVEQTKSAQGQSLKWITLAKMGKKRPLTSPLSMVPPTPEKLYFDAMDIISYHKNSLEPIPKGLYLGYFQSVSTVGYLKILSSKQHPNVVPHYKIRDCPNVSKEEWSWLKSLQEGEESSTNSELTSVFQEQIFKAVNQFVDQLKLEANEIADLRLYNFEVVELNEDVAFILLMPQADKVCLPPGSEEGSWEFPTTFGMPMPLFEIIQFHTYQQAFLKKYAQLSARLELEQAIAKHKRRQAFTKGEMELASEAFKNLEKFNTDLNTLWHQVLWIDGALKRGRETNQHSIPVSVIMSARSETTAARSNPSTNVPSVKDEIQPTCIRITPLYNTGLAPGTTVKLNISPFVSVKNVIELTVSQLEEFKRQKGIGATGVKNHDMNSFYVSASKGGHEFILEKDFHLADLGRDLPNFKLCLRRQSEDILQPSEQGPCTSV